jgi:hypothetical protein
MTTTTKELLNECANRQDNENGQQHIVPLHLIHQHNVVGIVAHRLNSHSATTTTTTMRIVQRRIRVPAGISARASFAALFGTSGAFAERFHAARGDVDVAVLDWLSGADQRLLSYTMCERDAGGSVKDRTKCLETQAFVADDAAWRVTAHLKPDGAVGNLFLVDTTYELRAHDILIEARCSCLKRIWGFASMVESVVEQQTAASLDLWCQLALDTLTNLASSGVIATTTTTTTAAAATSDTGSTSEEPPTSATTTTTTTTAVPARKHRSRSHYNRNRRPRVADLLPQQRSVLPHRQLSTMKRVAQGHDSILRLLASGDVSMMNSPSDDDVRRATATLDDELERGGGASLKEHNDHRSRSRRRACIYCIALLALMSVALLMLAQNVTFAGVPSTAAVQTTTMTTMEATTA